MVIPIPTLPSRIAPCPVGHRPTRRLSQSATDYDQADQLGADIGPARLGQRRGSQREICPGREEKGCLYANVRAGASTMRRAGRQAFPSRGIFMKAACGGLPPARIVARPNERVPPHVLSSPLGSAQAGELFAARVSYMPRAAQGRSFKVSGKAGCVIVAPGTVVSAIWITAGQQCRSRPRSRLRPTVASSPPTSGRRVYRPAQRHRPPIRSTTAPPSEHCAAPADCCNLSVCPVGSSR